VKKICQISFLFLALVFAFKSLSSIVISSKTVICCDVDVNENESEKGEKEEVKMKTIFEEGKLNDSADILVLNCFIKHFFHRNSEGIYLPPYFEISSPPPEIV
jgi:hypothetical protein